MFKAGDDLVKRFAAPGTSLGSLDAEAAATVIAAASDVALVLDREGVIRDVAFGSDELSREDYGAWLGQPLERHRHRRKPPQDRGAAARCGRQGAAALAPGQPSVGARRRRPGRLLGRAGRRRGPRRRDGPRPALDRRAAAAAGRGAAVDGARLLAPAPRRDALPAAVPDGLRGRADRRRGHAEGGRSQSRRERAAGRRRAPHRRAQSFLDGFDAGQRACARCAARRRARGRARRRRARARSPSGEARVPRVGVAVPPGECVAVPGAPVAAAGHGRTRGARHGAHAALLGNAADAAPDAFVVTEPDGRVLAANARSSSWRSSRPRSRRAASRSSAGSAGPASTSTC